MEEIEDYLLLINVWNCLSVRDGIQISPPHLRRTSPDVNEMNEWMHYHKKIDFVISWYQKWNLKKYICGYSRLLCSISLGLAKK